MNYALPSKFLRNLSCRFFVSLFVIFIFGAVLSSVTVAQEELKFGDSFTKVTKDPPEGKVDSPVESAQIPSAAEESESADVQLFRSSKLVQDLTTRYLLGSTSPQES